MGILHLGRWIENVIMESEGLGETVFGFELDERYGTLKIKVKSSRKDENVNGVPPGNKRPPSRTAI